MLISKLSACFNSCFPSVLNYYYLFGFSQLWLPTVQDVLHADWQEVWHSPQPPFFMDSFRVLLFKVFTCFICFASYAVLTIRQNYTIVYADSQVKNIAVQKQK